MELLTMFGAVIAAIAAVVNLWLTFFDRRDAIYVKYGQHTPITSPATGLYIVNTGKHPVYISDFGFIRENGKLLSIPYLEQTEPDPNDFDPHYYCVGTTTIAPHDLFSIGITYVEPIIGVYAITSTQSMMRISMVRSRFLPQILYKYLKVKLWPRYY
jgi:hypothetical protein